MSEYNGAYIAVMRNSEGYHLEPLFFPQRQKTREKPNFVTAIPINEDITTRRFGELNALTERGLDYLAQELAYH
ncbi:MAG: hypothetical protein AABW82_01805 [Nanoarchaeota archaeon]